MKLPLLRLTFFILTFISGSVQAAMTSNVSDTVFIESAYAKSLSEIEIAKVALKKTHSPHIQQYAQYMLDKHRAHISALSKLATSCQFHLSNEAFLDGKTHVFLPVRNWQTFEIVYAKKRLSEHRKIIQLYRAATMSKNDVIKQFSIAAMPELMHEWYLAQQLVDHVSSANVTSTEVALDEVSNISAI